MADSTAYLIAQQIMKVCTIGIALRHHVATMSLILQLQQSVSSCHNMSGHSTRTFKERHMPRGGRKGRGQGALQDFIVH